MLPAVLARVLMGAGVRSAGGAIARSARGAVAGVRGIASAFSALSDAAANDTKPKQEKKTQTNNVIYANFGMAGQAARGKISSNIASLPNTTKQTNTNASEKMPTEALLDTALKYLLSIDNNLKSQIDTEKRAYEQNVKDQREAIVESKSSFKFSDLKDKLSGLKSNVKEGASLAGKGLLGLGVLGTAAALIVDSLDQKELDALKENVEQFKSSFGWLGELASEIGAGGLMGFLFGGRGIKGRLKGGLIGMVASHVIDRLLGNGGGGGIDPETGQPVAGNKSMSAGGYAKSAIFGVIAAKYGLGYARDLKGRGQKIKALASTNSAYKSVSSVTKGESWLASRRGRKFVALVAKKLGKTLFKKIAKFLARIAASLLIGATGIGAIPAIIGIIVSVGSLIWDLYDVASSIWDAWNESEESPAIENAIQAAPVAPSNETAAKTSGSSISSTKSISASETGKPEEAMSFFESKGWTKEQAAGIVGNLVVESGLRTDALGDNGNAYGIAQWNKKGSPERIANFQRTMGKSLYGSSFKEQLEFVNWELNNSERNAGTSLRGATTSDDAAFIVDKLYERSSGVHLDRRQANAAALMAGDYGKVSTGGATGYSGGGIPSGSSGGIVNGGLEMVGNLFGKLGSTLVEPGVARSFTPSTSDVSSRINSESTNLQNDITFGIKNKQSTKKIESPVIPATTPGSSASKPARSISALDPNYQSINTLTQYVSHFRMAP